MSMELKDKIGFAVMYILLIVVFTFILINRYKFANIEEDDLTFITEVFSNSKNTKNNYDIFCESGNKYSISKILADDGTKSSHLVCFTPSNNSSKVSSPNLYFFFFAFIFV